MMVRKGVVRCEGCGDLRCGAFPDISIPSSSTQLSLFLWGFLVVILSGLRHIIHYFCDKN